jgi:putative transposase
MGFPADALADGIRVRVLVLIDLFARECLVLEGRPRFRGADVAMVLARVGAVHKLPPVVRCDPRAEFTSLVFDHSARARQVCLAFGRRATPDDNAPCDAFSGSVRRACLS